MILTKRLIQILLFLVTFFTYSFAIQNSQIEYEKSLNIVTDHTNNLIWQDNSEVTDYLESFETAQVYCDTLILNAYIDWRVPTIKEIQKVVDVSNQNGVNKNFKFIQAKIYNTISTFIDDESKMLVVDFKTGQTIITQKNGKNYVRCVRDIK